MSDSARTPPDLSAAATGFICRLTTAVPMPELASTYRAKSLGLMMHNAAAGVPYSGSQNADTP